MFIKKIINTIKRKCKTEKSKIERLERKKHTNSKQLKHKQKNSTYIHTYIHTSYIHTYKLTYS